MNQDLTKGKDTLIPVFDYQQKRRVGSETIKSASFGMVEFHLALLSALTLSS